MLLSSAPLPNISLLFCDNIYGLQIIQRLHGLQSTTKNNTTKLPPSPAAKQQ